MFSLMEGNALTKRGRAYFGWRSMSVLGGERVIERWKIIEDSPRPRMVNGQKRGHDDDEIITDERMFQNIMRLTGSGGVMEKRE